MLTDLTCVDPTGNSGGSVSDGQASIDVAAGETVTCTFTNEELLYIFWPAAMAYLRLSTHPAIFDRPLTPDVAAANLENLLFLPNVRCPGEAEGFWDVYRSLAAGQSIRGNLVPETHLVALMRQYGVYTIWARGRDFRRFEGIRARDPFE